MEIIGFQMEGWKRISIGKSSSLPASISNISTTLDNAEKSEKLLIGPTSLRPGPILFMVAATAVKVVTRSFPSNEIMSSEKIKSII